MQAGCFTLDNDVDFSNQTPSILSPEKSGDWGIGLSTPSDSRRESVRSSFSAMKSKFPWGQMRGKSSTSMDKSHKDDFWDGMSNPAMATGDEDLSIPDTGAKNGQDILDNTSHFDSQTVRKNKEERVVASGDVAGNKTKVIEVKGSTTNEDIKTSDMTCSPSKRTTH